MRALMQEEILLRWGRGREAADSAEVRIIVGHLAGRRWSYGWAGHGHGTIALTICDTNAVPWRRDRAARGQAAAAAVYGTRGALRWDRSEPGCGHERYGVPEWRVKKL
ncbi:hypothetical protein [Streptomyces ambofaciens]